MCLGRASRSYQGHTEPLKRDLHWTCVEGLGDTMLVLHVDSQTRACSKDQCFFLAVKGAVRVKESPDLGRTQRTRKKQNKPLGGGWNCSRQTDVPWGQNLEETDGTRSTESSQPSQAGAPGRKLLWSPLCRGECKERCHCHHWGWVMMSTWPGPCCAA